jgi:AAA family ATP:ADP antiporter
MGADSASTAPQRSLGERLLGLFTEVRPGEATTALLMFVNVFLILCAYYFVKPLREGWISISDIGGLSKMEVKAYTSFAQSILLLFIVSWYGRLAGRLNRVTLTTRATLFCISNLVIFWFLQPGFFFAALPFSGIVFYIWVGMFGVFVVAQFWTFCADVYTDERGKRLLPLIAIGATSGAVVGSWIVSQLVESGIVDTKMLLLLATVPLFVSIELTKIVEKREAGSNLPAAEEAPQGKDARSILSSARFVLLSRFLLAAALVTLLTNWVNTNGENLLFRVIQETLADQAAEQGVTDKSALLEFTRDGTTAFYGDFFFWVNTVALLLQAFVASRLLKYGGFAAIALMLPVIALLSYTAMALLPVLAIVKMMKIAENATDYSINNTARHVLWLPVSSAMKFRGKPAIDTLYVRLGDGLAAATVLVGVQMLAMSTRSFFVFNAILVLCWLAFSLLMVREHRKASDAAPPPR